MTVHALMDQDVKQCPMCDCKAFKDVEVVDKTFAQRNALSTSEAADICDDGVFQFWACLDCGFKFIVNPGIASTAQLKSAIYEYYLEYLPTLSHAQVVDAVGEFDDSIRMTHDPKGSGTLDHVNLHNCGSLTDMKFMFLRVIAAYLKECTVDEIVNVYVDIVVGGSSTVQGATESPDAPAKFVEAGAVFSDD